MPATVIDGREIAAAARQEIGQRVARLRETGGSVRLDAILVAHEGAAAGRVYAENQARQCAELGIDYQLTELPAGTGADDLDACIRDLNDDPAVNAIMIHLPLPGRIDTYRVQSRIAPEKDVEGVNPANIGNIVYGRSSLAPCTALAVLKLIDATGVDLRGKQVVVIGASNIVGKPIAVMLMRREATVVSCNEFTAGIEAMAACGDVLVAAAGVAGLVGPAWVKPGATVIDVGIHRVTEPDGTQRTTGDVDFEAVRGVAGAISPVPGGVGPVTVAMLLENVVAAAERTATSEGGRR